MLGLILLWLAQFVPYRVRSRVARLPGLSSAYERSLVAMGRRTVQVRGGPLDGAKLELDVGYEKAYWSGTHEPAVQRALARVARADMVAWDVGAHVGFFTVLLARRCRRVVAVEADSINAQRLRRNIDLNALPAEVREVAVDDHSGTVELEMGPFSGANRLAHIEGPLWKHPAPGVRVSVRAVTLDDLAADMELPDLLKIDVEGAEERVLAGARRVLEHVSVVLCEAHSAKLRQAVLDRLTAVGLDARMLGNDHVLALRS